MAQRRSTKIDFTVSEKERAAIKQRAHFSEQSVAAYARDAALCRSFPRRKAAVNAEAVAALNRIGNNLNQISRVGNTAKSFSRSETEIIGDLCTAISNALARIHGEVPL